MPQYSYTAVEANSDREVKGFIEAENETVAANELHKEGLFVTKLKVAAAKKAGKEPPKDSSTNCSLRQA